VVNLEALVNGPLDPDGVTLHLRRFDRVADLTVGAQQSASINPQVLAGTRPSGIPW
jgi:hypothetical protein